MARPRKDGLSFFSIDTNFFSDRKIKRLLRTFGCKGLSVYTFLLCEIYRDNGYFVQWDEEYSEDIAATLDKSIKENLVSDVLEHCLKSGLFDNEKFSKFGILTSAGIQKRYISAKESIGKKNYNPDEILLPEFNCFSGKTPINSDKRSKTGISGVLPPKEKKEKKEKVRKEKKLGVFSANDFLKSSEIPETSSLNQFPENLRTDSFKSAWAEWENHRKEIKKKLTPSTVGKQLKKLSAMGEAKAIQSINDSITNGWQGLFEPKQQQGQKGSFLNDLQNIDLEG